MALLSIEIRYVIMIFRDTNKFEYFKKGGFMTLRTNGGINVTKEKEIYCHYFKRYFTKKECKKFFTEDATIRKFGCADCEHNPDKDIISDILLLEDIKEKGGEMKKEIILTHKVAETFKELKRIAVNNSFSGDQIKAASNALDVEINTTRTYLFVLLKAGAIEKIGRGNYRILNVEFSIKEKSKKIGRPKKEKTRSESGIKTKEEIDAEIENLQKRIDVLKTIRDNYDLIKR